MAIVTVYSASWCPDCSAAKRVLTERKIEFNDIDIEKNPEAVDIIVSAMGKRVLPTLEYKGKFIDGNHFNALEFGKKLDQLLAD